MREDYSAGGTAWDYLPHDHARSRAYRWGEDGLAGFSDVEQRLCLALALWNGRDPILKERIFGLTGDRGQPRRGRQGVLVVPRRAAEPRLEPLALPLPAGASSPTPTSWPRTARRGKLDPEYELLDTGAFDDDRYWIVEARLREGRPSRPAADGPRHERRARGRHAARPPDRVVPEHVGLGDRGRDAARAPARRRGARRRPSIRSSASSSSSRTASRDVALLRERDERASACSARRPTTRDAEGRDQRPRRPGAATVATDAGTKAAFWYRLTSSRARRRPSACGSGPPAVDGNPWTDFDEVREPSGSRRPTSSTRS